jgi:hypothetical protein
MDFEFRYRGEARSVRFFWWGETIADGLQALLRPAAPPRSPAS